MEEIGHLIGHLPVSERVRADIRAVYDSIAQAESHVHGVPVTDIHFHEVGTMDAVADVTAVCRCLPRPRHISCGMYPSMAGPSRGSCVPPPGRLCCGILSPGSATCR